MIVDIAPTPQFNVTPFVAYVGLSRSNGRDTIWLICDFDDKIFTQHPSEDLWVEDEKLQHLVDDTERRLGMNHARHNVVWHYGFLSRMWQLLRNYEVPETL